MFPRENEKKSLASSLDKRVDIESAAGTTDGEGGFSETWSVKTANVPASVEPIKAVQQYKNRSVNVDATHFIKMRGDISIEERDRIAWDGRTFEILTIENIRERDELLFMTCKERR